MKRAVCLLLTGAMIFASSGCAGRDANPIQSYIPGDESKSCVVLRAEMAQIEAEVAERLPNSDKGAGNVLLGAAGLFLIVPWFFMDLKGADKIEVKALQRRYNALGIFVAEKKCELGADQEVAVDTNSTDTDAMKAEIAALRKELQNKVDVKPRVTQDNLAKTLADRSDSDVATTGDDDNSNM